MTKSIIKIAMSLLFATLFIGCVTVTRTSKRTTFTPDKVELRINISDLKFLGESEITTSYHTYLGFISVIDSINGQPYDPTIKRNTKIEGLRASGKINKALYKVVEDFPDATYYKIVYDRKVVDKLFLGRDVKQTVRIHAYSFK
jgi:hypothetical protein